MNRSVRALILLALAYVSVGWLAFYDYVLPIDSPVQWLILSGIEQVLNWLLPSLALVYLYIQVSKHSGVQGTLVNETRLIVPVIILVLLSGVSFGSHSAGQLLSDLAATTNNQYLLQLGYIYDELIGHLFLISSSILVFLLALVELNREGHTLSRIDYFTLTGVGLLNGFIWGLGIVEGGSMYLVVSPLSIFLLVYVYRLSRIKTLNLSQFPFTLYYFISTTLMVSLSVVWSVMHGPLTQVTDIIGKGL